MPFQKIEFSSHVLGWYIILYWFKWCWYHKRIFSRRKDTYNYESIIKNYISQQIFVKSWPSHKSNYNNKKVLFFLETKRPHSRFSQSPSLKKLPQQRVWYFSIPNDRKRPWENFEGMFPELFLRYMHKSEKYGKNDQISYFHLRFWFKIELFEG